MRDERGVLILPFFVLFIGPGIGALAYLTWQGLNSLGWIAFGVEALAMLYFLNRWFLFLSQHLGRWSGLLGRAESKAA